MKVIYDPAVDVLRIILRDAQVFESDETRPGVILDYDEDGQILGLEILDAASLVSDPRAVELALAG